MHPPRRLAEGINRGNRSLSTDDPRSDESDLAMEQLLTVAKAMQVLQAFSYEKPVLGVSELARKLGMGKSSVHRILSTMTEQGFVTKTDDDRYRLGLKLLELGQLVVSSLELRQVAHSPMERLHNDSGATVQIAVLDGTDAMFVYRIESTSTLRTFSRVGRRVPAHTTSSGKCLLAFSDPMWTDEVVRRGLKRVGPRSITTERGLREATAKIRKDGYVVSVEENERGLVSIGAPVFGHDGRCIAAVSMVGSILRLSAEEIPRFTQMVRRCALEISRGMGLPDQASRAVAAR